MWKKGGISKLKLQQRGKMPSKVKTKLKREKKFKKKTKMKGNMYI
jgi:hypothetical protein